MISTLLSYDQGDVRIFDQTLGKQDALIREKIGVVFQKSMLDDLLTVYENLKIRASFY
ncbi:MAG: hypothetical protein UMR38_06160 [Candidatus Izemoplasma sp.]|nr:hypothetical protein [Candidatus Izemoplasma sp.]